MVYRLILPDYVKKANPSMPRVLENEYSDKDIECLNNEGYNVYYLPNYPSKYNKGVTVEGAHIDTFTCVFVDMDLKDGVYVDKDEFIMQLATFPLQPSRIVDSGNGVHVYWDVVDLDAMTFLKLQRRLMRLLNTDDAVAKIYQLMRYPGTFNTKKENDWKKCELIFQDNVTYTCEDLDKALPPLTKEDADYCAQHYDKTYNLNNQNIKVDDVLPIKFCKLLKENKEVKSLWTSTSEDRSKDDYRLGHIMFASGFTKDEARSVLVNAAKALQRAPKHRITYAENIIDKIWTYEISQNKESLSKSVKDILSKGEAVIKGTRFPCHPILDDTKKGFRLGQVIGLVGGAGVGKTTMAMNMFLWFTERNPDYEHFFVSLEQPENEIAERWATITQGDESLHSKVHILSNYDSDGNYRHLSLDDIKDYILEFQKTTGKKIGTVVIDHIGVLKKQTKNGENQGIVEICHQLKSFAVATNTMVIMQSQAPREKAGIGDLELNKDAAYGTVFFEAYVDYLLLIWQPLKRVYSEGAPTVMAFKFGKIRHKKQNEDKIKEDVRYQVFFDPQTERIREITQQEEKSILFYGNKAANLRKQDRKTDVLTYESRRVEAKEDSGAVVHE